MKVKTLEELVNEGALEGKRVFIRADMNVPRDAEGQSLPAYPSVC